MNWNRLRSLSGAVMLGVFLTGCSGATDWFSRDDSDSPLPPPLEADADGVVPDKTGRKDDAEASETTAADDAGEASAEPGAESETASSGDEAEPDADAAKPSAAPRQLAGALISDQEKAKHSDEELRGGRVAAVAPPRPAPPGPPVKKPEAGRAEAAEPSPPALPQGRVTGAPLPAGRGAAPQEAATAPAAPLTTSPMESTTRPPAPQAARAAPQIERLVPQSAARPAPLTARGVASAAIAAPVPVSPAAGALPAAAYPATGFQPSRAQPLPPSLLAALPPGVASRYQETATTVIGAGAANAGLAGAPGAGAYASIPFASGSTRLSPSDLAKIAAAADAYRGRGGRVRLVGHASSESGGGSASEQMIANWEISQARANVVADALIAGGVAAGDVQIEAVGDGAAAGGSGAAYRRVDIYIE